MTLKVTLVPLTPFPKCHVKAKPVSTSDSHTLLIDLQGWIRSRTHSSPVLAIKYIDGSVKAFSSAIQRPDVKKHLEAKYPRRSFTDQCGFSLRVDAARVVLIGIQLGSCHIWEYSVLTSELSSPQLLVIGPSHIVRFEHAIKTRLIPDLAVSYKLLGLGGMPIWSPLISDLLQTPKIDETERIFFLVGDFRFGNSILKDSIYPKPCSLEGHNGINGNLISDGADHLLYRLSLSFLDKYSAFSHLRARFLFWDLCYRELSNSKQGRYQQDGRYRHPVWNYSDVCKRYPKHGIESSAIVNDGSALFIDNSAHPSVLGHSYLWHQMHGREDFDIDSMLFRLELSVRAQFIRHRCDSPFFFVGDSIFIDYMIRFQESRAMPFPSNLVFLDQLSIPDIPKGSSVVYCPRIIAKGCDSQRLREGIASVRATIAEMKAVHSRVNVVIYDIWAVEATRKNIHFNSHFNHLLYEESTGEVEDLLGLGSEGFRISETSSPSRMLEINHELCPTFYGAVSIILKSLVGIDEAQVEESYDRMIRPIFFPPKSKS
jgi:hypothetical protein